jgi:uncharacterized protein YjlB
MAAHKVGADSWRDAALAHHHLHCHVLLLLLLLGL